MMRDRIGVGLVLAVLISVTFISSNPLVCTVGGGGAVFAAGLLVLICWDTDWTMEQATVLLLLPAALTGSALAAEILQKVRTGQVASADSAVAKWVTGGVLIAIAAVSVAAAAARGVRRRPDRSRFQHEAARDIAELTDSWSGRRDQAGDDPSETGG